MSKLYEMNATISRSLSDKLIKLAAPLVNHLGVTHFYHYIFMHDGHYAALGLNQAWQEHLSACDETKKYIPFFYLNRKTHNGMLFNQAVASKDWHNLTAFAEKNFNINLGLQITQTIDCGMEGFGFALKTNDFAHHMALLNELPLLKLFISEYKKKINASILKDNLVDLRAEFELCTKPNQKTVSSTRELILKEMKIAESVMFSKREQEVIQQLLKGCPTSAEIAEHLYISTRTVEDHIVNIKDKLDCYTKSQLILKLQELESFGFI